MATEPAVHIRWRVADKWAGNFYAVMHNPIENGSLVLCGAEPTTDDVSWRECRPRDVENLAIVTCGECKRLRQLHVECTPA